MKDVLEFSELKCLMQRDSVECHRFYLLFVNWPNWSIFLVAEWSNPRAFNITSSSYCSKSAVTAGLTCLSSHASRRSAVVLDRGQLISFPSIESHRRRTPRVSIHLATVPETSATSCSLPLSRKAARCAALFWNCTS